MVADNPQRYPVEDIIMRTPYELLYQQRKKVKLVAIPGGYARVMID
jgi:hypothetical protein